MEHAHITAHVRTFHVECSAKTLEELATSLMMYQACELLPLLFLKGREAIIVNIMKASNVDLIGSKLSRAIKVIDCYEESLAVGALPTEVLWQATYSTGIPHHLRFLGPPSVFYYRCQLPLSANNSPASMSCIRKMARFRIRK